MKVNKEKIKNYWETNKKSICNGLAVGVCLTVGAFIGYEYFRKVEIGNRVVVENENVNKILNDALEEYSKGMSVFAGRNDTPIKINELGELGELIKEFDAPDNADFTHFICIGKPIIE